MATGSTSNYNLPYPLSTDPVNVASDIQDLSDSLDAFLTTPAFIGNLTVNAGGLNTSSATAAVFNTGATTLNVGGAATVVNIGNTSGQVNVHGNFNIATGKVYEINDTTVLSSSALGTGIVSSSLTAVGTITTGTWNATTIAVNRGGTGLTSYTIGDIVYASGTTTLTRLAGVATGNALISGGVGAAPSWGKIGLTTHISGTLPVENGGTGITSFGTGVATWLGTPTSANLAAAVTDETGTGALVFANSPALSGTPTSTTAAVDTNTTQIATTAYVIGQGYLKSATASSTYAPITSPTFTGTVSSQGTVLLMSSATTGSPVDDVSFRVERGTSPDVEIRWNETGDGWQFTNDGTTYFDIPISSGGDTGLQDVLMFAGM